MASGIHTYTDEDGTEYELDWYGLGDISDTERKTHEKKLEAVAELMVEDYLKPALDVGDRISLSELRLRLSLWEQPDAKVWMTTPSGYVEDDEAQEQRKEFNRHHNNARTDSILVNGNRYEIKIDVRPF